MTTETGFAAQLSRDGFSKAFAGSYEPCCINTDHTHSFEVRGLVVSVEMTITLVGGSACRFGPGDVFVMHCGQAHKEEVGELGMQYLYGSREPEQS